MSASPAGYNEPPGEPTALHTICWGCRAYIEGCSSLDPVCETGDADGSHNNRATCCFHFSEEANAKAEEHIRLKNELAKMRRGDQPQVSVAFSVYKGGERIDRNPLARDLPKL